MTKKCIIFLLNFSLLCRFTAVTTACPPPECPDCYYLAGSNCVPCGDCYKCVDGDCVACKCWDTGTPIVGSINVQNAKLCEEKTHTSSVSDTDHWFKPGVGEGHPGDSLTYSWTASDGTPLSSNAANFTWRAPPCVQVVTITLRVDDVPNSMDDPCPGSSRDDDYADFQGTSTVSLPDGCGFCTGPPTPPTPSISEKDPPCTQCTPDWAGYFDIDNSIVDHTYTLKTPCYDNCKWYAYLDTVHTTVDICRSCPANPPTVACLSEVADMNEAEACAHKKNFPHDPVQWGDRSTSNWCRDCVVVHEETHMNKDWIQDSLQPEIDAFADWCANHPIDIDCSVSDSTNCASALTAAKKAAYDAQWADRVSAACATYDAQEADAQAAELACYQEILNALKAKCP